jgi:hypothetical protein
VLGDGNAKKLKPIPTICCASYFTHSAGILPSAVTAEDVA